MLPCYDLATKHWEHVVQAVWSACFLGAAKRRLAWKTAEMQPQVQSHAVFAERFCVIQHEFQVGFRDVHGGHGLGCN